MRALLIFIFIFLNGFNVYSQNTYVVGVAIDSLTNYKIKDVTVSTFENDKNTGNFLSDINGHFKIPLTLFNSSSRIEMRAVSYKDFFFIKNSTSKLETVNFYIGEFKLVPNGINLDEVLIKKRKRYRDTTNISLSDKHFEREVMIEDLFSKSMGFYKDSNGRLYYKGKLVSDVFVNGATFFGKNNMDIFKNLPALTLNNIEIIETNIDSLTNTTLHSPAIKVNLKLKAKYNKGKFGSLNLGIGTLERYVGAADLYTYKKDGQLSFSLNSNNINIGDSFSEPRINFVSNGNNTLSHISKLTYRNLFYKNKVELVAYLKTKMNQATAESESDRIDENINQFSKTFNKSKVNSFALEGTNINLIYKIDSLNTLRFYQILDYNNGKQIDTLSYLISANEILNTSSIYKIRNSETKSLLNKISYQKLFSSKKGRLLNMSLSIDDKKHEVAENNSVSNHLSNVNRKYFVEGNRDVLEKSINFANDFIEPLDETGYLTILTGYKKEKLLFNEDIRSDSLSNKASVMSLGYQYFNLGVKVYKNFDKLTLEGSFSEVVNIRDIGEDIKHAFWNNDAKIVIDYKLSRNRNFSTQYLKTVNYPNAIQLTGVNNSFDLISQQQSNLKLKPEIKNRLEISYDLKKTDSINLSLNGNIERYNSRFGFTINAIPGQTQSTKIDNVGNSLNADVSLNFSKNLVNGHNFNYRLSLSYQELPGVINFEQQLSKSLIVSQAISLNKGLFKGFMSISPSLSTSYSRYSFQNSNGNQFNMIYSDKLSFSLFKFQLNAYPFLNFNYSINKNFTFALNSEIRRSFLKNYGSIWLKAYDVFNSFSYINNINTASYIQNVKYSNVNRYFLLGISVKFNSMR